MSGVTASDLTSEVGPDWRSSDVVEQRPELGCGVGDDNMTVHVP